jgi:hypothetical protein
MKYFIRTGDGRELEVRSGSHVVMLFRQHFLTPDDEIRKDGSTRWRKLREVPEYASMVRAEEHDKRQFKWLLYASTAAVFALLLAAMLFK